MVEKDKLARCYFCGQPTNGLFVGHNNDDKPICDKCYKARKEEERKVNIREMRVPARYEGVALTNFQPWNENAKQVLEYAKKYVDDISNDTAPELLMFRGGSGTGKGHLLYSLAYEICATHKCVVVKLPDMIRDIRSSWKDEEKGEDETLRKYRNAEWLAIDECSRHAFYGQAKQHLYDVLDYRYERFYPTVLTSNEDDAGLLEVFGEAILDRLNGSGGILDFGNKSFRSRK